MIERNAMVKICKVLNYLAAMLMLVSVIFRFFEFKLLHHEPFFFLFTFYLMFFSAVLIIAELKMRGLLMYVEFINGRIGKGMFILFVGLLMFDEQR